MLELVKITKRKEEDTMTNTNTINAKNIIFYVLASGELKA